MLFAKKLAIASLFCCAMTVAGCADNPGTWPKEKLVEHVKDSLIKEGVEMTEVTLTEKEGGASRELVWSRVVSISPALRSL